MGTVEIHHAYAWICDECGQDNFCWALRPEMSHEELKELKEEHGITSYELGEWLMAPNRVKCKHCGMEYQTEYDS